MSIFKNQLELKFSEFNSVVATDKSEWTIKGFIDVYKNIYTISADTKVISKLIELMIFPVIARFAQENNYIMQLASHQNHYPDITFIEKGTNKKIALDLKSSYKIGSDKINGMTLGAFTGYFRNRTSTKNITFPYQDYDEHYVLGVIYTKTDLFKCEEFLNEKGIKVNKKIRDAIEKELLASDEDAESELINLLESQMNDLLISRDEILIAIDTFKVDERKIHSIDNLNGIMSVVRDFTFFVQEKWKIAIDRPGSGNTKNIGSTTNIQELIEGKGIFTKHQNGKELFDQFWKNYMTKDMARAVDLDEAPYRNLQTFFQYIEELKAE